MHHKTNSAFEKLYGLILLSLTKGLGVINIRNLLSYFGDVNKILSANKSQLLKVEGVGKITAENILNQANEAKQIAENEIKFIKKYNINFVCIGDKNYPYNLSQCVDAPLFLFYKGEINFSQKYISIVGTRNNTSYGKQNCKQLISDLKTNGHNPVIISGLAYGTDICAHKTALNNELKTIAVLAHGLDRIYPSSHTEVARKIVDNGALVTEFLSSTAPERQNFVKRNRIIAGLSECTVVVESGEKGGSLITADIANSYNRDVFAFPGRTDSKQSKGCNKLIKTHKAALIENIKDLEYIMGWQAKSGNNQLKLEMQVKLNETEEKIYKLIMQEKSINIDILAHKLNMNISELSTSLLTMELNGYIRSYPGNLYKVC